MPFSSPTYSSFIPIYPHACMITFHARFLSLHPQCPLPTAHFLTPITYPFHSSYPPHAFPLFIPAKPIFFHSCMAMHGQVMPISPYANLHTRILHALMYITTLPYITILHLPIFLLLTTFLSLHHHYHQTLIFSLTHSLSTPYPVIPIFQIPINPISSTFAWPHFLAHFQSPLNLFSCTMDWRSPRPVSAF